MKKLHLIMLAGALAASLNASAQFSNNTRTSSGETSYTTEEIVPSYDRFQISYVNEKISPDKGDDYSTNGVGLKWIHGFSVSKNLPLYVQTGLDLHVGFWSDDIKMKDYGDNTYQKTKLTTLNAAIPVNLAYKFNVSPSFSIEPLVGLNVKFNILSKTKNSVDTDLDWLTEKIKDMDKEEFEETFEFKESINNFDKKDTGSKDTAWKRFQIGWHIGANFIFSQKYYAGITYGTDFMELCKKTNSSTLTVGLGYVF